MFVAYIDESGSKHDSTILCLAGLLSSVRQWRELEREWKRTLLDSPLPRDDTGKPMAFHMTDFEAGRGDFSGTHWNQKLKTDLIGRLTGIMVRRVLLRVYSVLSLEEYKLFVPGDKNLKNAYAMCALGVVSRIGHWARTRSAAKIPYLFERAQGVDQGRAKNAIKAIANLDTRGSLQIGAVSSGDKSDIPLQATDIWAYEVRKYFHRQFEEPSVYSVRRSLKKLCEIPDGQGFALIGEDLQFLLDQMVKSAGDSLVEIPLRPRPLSLGSRPRIFRDGK